jgi:hypothetical protein
VPRRRTSIISWTVLQEVQRLQKEGPSADLTTKAKESAKRGYETALRPAGGWDGCRR